jgi:large-conductance mechanosensitive channel
MREYIEENKDKENKDQKNKGQENKESDPIRHINQRVEGFFGRLVDFLKEWSVIGIAIGVIVAQAAKDFVDAVVRGLIIPFFKLFFPTDEVGAWSFNLGAVRFDIGSVLSSFITLIIIIAFLYYLVRRIMQRYGQNSEQKINTEAEAKIKPEK